MAHTHDEGNRPRDLVGTVAGYDVLTVGDAVLVGRDGERPVTRTVAGLGQFLAGARDLRPGWAALPDFEVVYLWDAGDGGFGYGLNIDAPDLSEFGYAPFAD